MSAPAEGFHPTLLSNFSYPARWGVLIVLSAFFTALLTWAEMPATLLLGPMIAGILLENAGAELKLPQLPFKFAQAIIGCMIARVFTPGMIQSFLHRWPLFVAIGLLIITASCFLGWALSRRRVLQETTAIWGLLPGAASAMMIIADDYGADARLVAFMQYLRVVMIVLTASLVARFWVSGSVSATVVPAGWFASVHGWPLVETIAIAAGGAAAAKVLRIPAGGMMAPMVIGIVLQASGAVEIELPRSLLAASYLFLGWNVGLRFTREILGHAIRALPQIVLSIVALIAFCGGIAFALVELMHVDPLTAYLATSPGGADSVAIIAASTKVDTGFVMALQIVRFMLVLIVGPVLSRFVAGRITSHALRNGSSR